jgi:endonuclease-3 related protein
MPSFFKVYTKLFAFYGPQHWWPASLHFEVMVGAILTQNTAWVNVEKAIANLRANQALSPSVVCDTPVKQLAQWLKPSGYFNVKARRLKHYCEWYLKQGGYAKLAVWETPRLRRALLSVHGIGPETADDILLYAFARPVFVIDAYTKRLFARLGLVEENISYPKLQARITASLKRSLSRQGYNEMAITQCFNEYHALIVRHAKDFCRVRPRCGGCALHYDCPSYMDSPDGCHPDVRRQSLSSRGTEPALALISTLSLIRRKTRDLG